MKRFNTTIDSDVRDNAACDRCRNSEVRHTDADGLCTKVKSVVDGLPVRCVGGWANDKIYYLLQYFQIFAKGMAKKWGKFRYVEICSGPGRCCTRNCKDKNVEHSINWPQFRDNATALLDSFGSKYYIKEDLRKAV